MEYNYVFVDKEGDDGNRKSLKKIKGSIKEPKAGVNIGNKGENSLICGKDRRLGHQRIIEGVGQKEV